MQFSQNHNFGFTTVQQISSEIRYKNAAAIENLKHTNLW